MKDQVRIYIEEKTVSLLGSTGKAAYLEMNEIRKLPHTTHKNKLKIVERPKIRLGIINRKENTGRKLFDIKYSNIFLDQSPKAKKQKQK